jgi:Xaa-Pro aminopeptidase
MSTEPVIRAGIPQTNRSLYHRIRFSVGDPTAIIDLPGTGSTLIIRDIEMGRAREHARADAVHCPADFAPASGLSADRETATAQAAAECLRRAGVDRVLADRSLPLIFAHHLEAAGIGVTCDLDLGVVDRRAKDDAELAHLRNAQSVTERAMAMACEMVGGATASADGTLLVSGEPLTSERVRTAIDVFLLGEGFTTSPSIVAGGPQGADCHERGTGLLHTGETVIIDIFPQDPVSLYNGDCTRTVVHGAIPDTIAQLHAVVAEAKAAATAATRPGSSGDAVHAATRSVIEQHGFEMGLPPEGATGARMVHGTGHGVGLDVHEPPLLDVGGPELVKGDVLTIEPGLYDPALGGIRIEDMVAVTATGCENFNTLPEGLDWS